MIYTQSAALLVVVVGASIYLDLVAHRRRESISVRDAMGWTAFWVLLSLAFAGYLWVAHSREDAGRFLSGWLLEKSLSLDNLMVFVAVFSAFGVRSGLQHRILYFGILGALVFRLVFVVLGETFMHLFSHWADLVFAAVVGFSAVQMLRGGESDDEVDYDKMWTIRLFKRFVPVFPRLDGERFFVSAERVEALRRADSSAVPSREGARRFMTPAFVCLIAIETADVGFSFDSVPVVIAETRKPFLIYASMVFAILGLRSLYFVIQALNERLQYLSKAVALTLFFITYKLAAAGLEGMLSVRLWRPTPIVSTTIVFSMLALGCMASLFATAGPAPQPSPAPAPEGADSNEP